MHDSLPQERQEVMLAAGGLGVGSFWTAVPTEDCMRTSNAQWTMIFRSRLALPLPLPADARCLGLLGGVSRRLLALAASS